MENDALYYVGGIVERDGLLYATGSVYQGAAPFQLIRSFFAQMDPFAGQVNWAKQNNPVLPVLKFTICILAKTEYC
ncbi:MAG TPA: hypothetical protein VKR32_04150 [Puia sp.]|nr:hypothetical protein [Puia sp.]